jgi:hypothetical protein
MRLVIVALVMWLALLVWVGWEVSRGPFPNPCVAAQCG